MPDETCEVIAIGKLPRVPMEIPVTNPIDRSVINPRWDKAKAMIGEKVLLKVELRNQYENATVEYKIYPEGADTKKDQPIQKLYERNEGGKSEAEWLPVWPKFNEGEEQPETVNYIFTAVSFGCAEVKSGPITIEKDVLNIYLVNEQTGEPIPGIKYRAEFADGTYREGILDENGCARELDIPKGEIKVRFETGEELFIDGQE